MEKVAILGGGVGALSAAFELTEMDPAGKRFDITVYQVGWRLGGKGAVGRNDALHDRVEEHGLHVWTGFYDNAFHLVDRCYAALQRSGKPVPFGSRFAAFQELDCATLMQQAGNQWLPWRFDLPRRDGTPGDFEDTAAPDRVDHVRNLVEAAEAILARSTLSGFPLLQENLRVAMVRANQLPGHPARVTGDERADLRRRIADAQAMLHHGWLQLDALGIMRSKHGPEVDRDAILVELALALGRGLLADDVFSQGFDALEHLEWSDWMRSNGCTEPTLESGVVQGCYDYVFGFVRGTRNVAAGTGTRLLLKLLFEYKDAFFFVMRAPMGEVLFAPLYTVLRDRGVKFEFFHRVENLVLSADGSAIDKIEMSVQATPQGAYDPLVAVQDGSGGTIPSWPSRPKFQSLLEGEEIRTGGHDLESAWTGWRNVGAKTLQRGSGFDRVVLGIGLGAFRWICKELVARHPRWQTMVDKVQTTPTQALQLWTTCATRDLAGPGDGVTIASSFAKPLDSWGDLSLMLGQETWPMPRPQGLHYFVGSFRPSEPLPPPGPGNEGFPGRQLAHAADLQLHWIRNSLGKLWPGVLDAGGGVRWDLLSDPAGRVGEARLAAQYARVNVNPSDQYVLSVAGSVGARMTADGSGIANLYLAGDWVRTGLDAGCVEAAVMAGRAAAGAITGMEVDMPNARDFSDSGLVNVILPGLTLLRKLEHRAAGGTGFIDGYCTVLSGPADEVQSHLPPGVKLAKGSGPRHDVVLVFARQHHVRPGLMPFGGLEYAEVFEIIPEVELEHATAGTPLLFSFMPNLLVDQLVPVVVGKNVYGFNKHLARIHHGGGSFDVHSAFGASRAQFTQQGLPGAIQNFPEIEKLRKRFQLPLIGLAPDGSFVVSSVRFDLDAGTFQRVTGSIATGLPFVSAGLQIQVQIDPLKPDWGFRMQCPWRLSLPVSDMGHPGPGDHHARALVAHYSQRVLGKFPARR